MKFGEIIKETRCSVLVFVSTSSKSMDLNQLVDEIDQDNVRVRRVNGESNPVLVDALRIKSFPTYMVYVDRQCVYRASGESITIPTLLKVIKNNLT